MLHEGVEVWNSSIRSILEEVIPTNFRCLLLELTDGCQSIRAVEFEPVPDLSVEVPRGSKVLLK